MLRIFLIELDLFMIVKRYEAGDPMTYDQVMHYMSRLCYCPMAEA